ncbi:MAG TPA: NADPH-dependent FMN reductase [Candidatus Saccharimonadales bacterium]
MKVQLVLGSTRPTRISPTIANWMIENLPKHEGGIEFEIIDIKTWDLPMFDEPLHPSMHDYKHDYTKAWSEKISQADGFIFLTSEYNAGYPASLKNAIDYLFQEWTDKPVMITSYGFGGGTSASVQLKQVAERLKMRPTATSPDFAFTGEMRNEDGQLKDIKADFAPYVDKLQKGINELIVLINATEQVTH